MCSVKKGVLRYFAKFTGKHLCQRLFFNKVAGLRPATLLKKSLWHRCFPMNFAKFLRTPFYRTPLDDCFCSYFSLVFIIKMFLHCCYVSLVHLIVLDIQHSNYCNTNENLFQSPEPPGYTQYCKMELLISNI